MKYLLIFLLLISCPAYAGLKAVTTVPTTAASIAAAIQTQTGCSTAGYVWVPSTNTCSAGGGGTFNKGTVSAPGWAVSTDTASGLFQSATSSTLSVAAGGKEAGRFLQGSGTVVNYPTFAGAATGANPIIAAAGTDTNITLNLTPQGTGNLNLTTGGILFNGNNAIRFPTTDSTTGGSIAIGVNALSGQTSSAAYGNTAIGYQALNGTMTTAALADTAVGYQAGNSITTGRRNSALGNSALTNDNIGGDNTAFGFQALYTNSSSSGETAVGSQALVVATGARNTAFGAFTGGTVTNGTNNTLIGYNVANTTLTTGNSNILIGTSTAVDTVASSTSNEINIGGMIFANSNSLAAPVVSACGTNTIDARANNKSGTVSITAGTPASCTITFAGTGYSTWNHCRVTSQSVNAAFAYSYTTTVLTVTGTALAGKIDYDCDGV